MKPIRIFDDIFLGTLIILSIVDFFGFLPPDIDYFTKIVSFGMIGYLLYKVSLTKVFFGLRQRTADILLILTYFCFTLNKFAGYSVVASKESVFLHDFFAFMANPAIEICGFYIGGISLFFFALYFTSIKIEKKSTVYVLHGNSKNKIARFFIVYLILTSFLIIVFNNAIEWLGMALDTPIAFLAVLIYIYVWIMLHRHHKKFDADHFINKVGSFGEKFYRGFIDLFQTKRIALGISGILVMFLLVDFGNFIVPYLINFRSSLYFEQIGGEQQALVSLIAQEPMRNIFDKISVGYAYFFNALATVFFLVLPAYIWYKVYKRRGFNASNLSLGLFFSSAAIFILKPVFILEPILSNGLIGVNVNTTNITDGFLPYAVLISFLIGVIAFVFSMKDFLKKKIVIIGLILLAEQVLVYIGLYFYSMMKYYVLAIISVNNLFFIF